MEAATRRGISLAFSRPLRGTASIPSPYEASICTNTAEPLHLRCSATPRCRQRAYATLPFNSRTAASRNQLSILLQPYSFSAWFPYHKPVASIRSSPLHTVGSSLRGHHTTMCRNSQGASCRWNVGAIRLEIVAHPAYPLPDAERAHPRVPRHPTLPCHDRTSASECQSLLALSIAVPGGKSARPFHQYDQAVRGMSQLAPSFAG